MWGKNTGYGEGVRAKELMHAHLTGSRARLFQTSASLTALPDG